MFLLSYARRYFAADAAPEMLAEFRPMLFPGSAQLYKAQCYLTRFLPTNDVAAVQAWLPEMMNVWSWVQNLRDWNLQWLFLMARYGPRAAGASRGDRRSL